jgi:glycosyltransferase involved in cell wall biosynthesis
MNNRPLRIAKFGFRSIPPREGSAGADTCATELSTRLAKRGLTVVCYNRLYGNEKIIHNSYQGIKLFYFKTVKKSGFDTLIHSAKTTFHIIFRNTANIVHISNGGNSIWGIFFRLFGKKVIVTQDGLDWERRKWPWYGRIFLYFSAYLTSKIPHIVVFDNPFAKELFEKKFKKKYEMIPTGVDVSEIQDDPGILEKYGLQSGEYFLFVGRFIRDKGLHTLVPAFEKLNTTKKLVLVGGSPNPSDYERKIKETTDHRIIMPGYIYGNDMLNLIKNAYLYIQPSEVEGQSPVILTVMAIGTPLLCSDIKENLYVVQDTARTFKNRDIDDIYHEMEFALQNEIAIKELAQKAKKSILTKYSWNKVTDKYVELYNKLLV